MFFFPSLSIFVSAALQWQKPRYETFSSRLMLARSLHPTSFTRLSFHSGAEGKSSIKEIYSFESSQERGVWYSTLRKNAHWAALMLNDWGVSLWKILGVGDNFMLFCADILRKSNDRIYLKNRKIIFMLPRHTGKVKKKFSQLLRCKKWQAWAPHHGPSVAAAFLVQYENCYCTLAQS